MKPKRKANLTIQDIGDETIVYDPERENVHVLNQTAQLIWNLCDGEHTMDEIHKFLIEQFPSISQNDLLVDLQSTLNEFKEKKIIL